MRGTKYPAFIVDILLLLKIPFSFMPYCCTNCKTCLKNLFPSDEAEMEYLKIAQDLEMYGVNYFQIKVSDERLPIFLSMMLKRG